MNHIDHNLFHLALKEIAAGAEVNKKGQTIIIGEQGKSSLTVEQMALVLGFIRTHANYLEAKDAGILTQLQSRLSAEVPEDTRQDILAFFQKLHGYDPSKIDAKLPKCPKSLFSSCSFLDLRHSSALLLAELSKILVDPRLILTDKLSVVREVPANWNPSEVIAALKQARENFGLQSPQLCKVIDDLVAKHEDSQFILLTKLTQALNDPSLTVTAQLSVVRGKPDGWQSSEVLNSLQKVRKWLDANQIHMREVIDRLIEEHQPPKMVKLGLCIEETETGDNGFVKMGLQKCIENGIPVLTTRALLRSNWISLNKSHEYGKTYTQKEGGLVLCVPDGVKIEDLGINLSEFEKGSEETKPLEFIAFDPQKDVQRVFLQQNKGPEIHRLILAMGHGAPSAMGEARICGLSTVNFQEMLQVLSDNGLAFLSVMTCFGGGENVTRISAPDGTVPCPILLLNSTESIALGNPKQFELATKLLGEVESKLYAPLPSGRTPRLPHSLHKKDLREIGKLAITLSPIFDLQNLQTIILPSKREDIPRVTYIGATPPSIVDLDEAIRKYRKKNLASLQDQVQISVDTSQAMTLFCSAPNLPAVIEVKGKESAVGIAARGGNSVHFIDELKIPNLTLDQFALTSANTVARFSWGSPARLIGANKLFYFNKLQCKDAAGNLKDYYDVMISLTVTKPELSYSDSEGRYYSRAIALNHAQEGINTFFFSIPNSAVHVRPEKLIDNEMDVIFSRFSQFLLCCPSEKHLLATTAGQLSIEDLWDDLVSKMENRLAPADVELYRMALQPKSLKSMMEKIEALPSEVQQRAADHLLRLAILSDNDAAVYQLLTRFGPWMRPLVDGKSALHIAAEQGCIAVTKRLLKEIKEPDQKDDVGRTPLHYAVISMHQEIVEILRNTCSDMAPDMIDKTPLDYALMNERKEMVCELLKSGRKPIEEASTFTMLVQASKDPSVMQAIIDSKRTLPPVTSVEGKTFLEHFLLFFIDYSDATKSLEILMASGCYTAESVDEHGHHLLMRILLKGHFINKENLRILLKHFPLSEQDRLQLSQKFLEKQIQHPTGSGSLPLMKTLGIAPKPSEAWSDLLVKAFEDRYSFELMKTYIDAGVEADWKKLYDKAVKKNLLDILFKLISDYQPDLSRDENWKEVCSTYIEKGRMEQVVLLKKCGVRPEQPIETKGMSAERLFAWVKEDPKRLPVFIRSVEGLKDIDPKSSAATSCLAFLLIWASFDVLNHSLESQLKTAINMLTEIGVRYDPKHKEITPDTWEKYETNPFNAWMRACEMISGFKQNPEFCGLIDAELQRGSLTAENVMHLFSQDVPLDYELLSEDCMASLLSEQGEIFVAKVTEAGVKISGKIATKAFTKVLKNLERIALEMEDQLSSGMQDPEIYLKNSAYEDSLRKIVSFLIASGKVEANDPELNQFPQYRLRYLELVRYEQGIRPSTEECLRRYWANRNDPLNDVIQRDLQPDPKSEIALEALSAAFYAKNWIEFSRLKKLGVKLQNLNKILETLKSTFNGFVGEEECESLNMLLSEGLDPSLLHDAELREAIQKGVRAILNDPNANISQIKHMSKLIELAGPIDLKSPSPAVANVLSKNKNCIDDLKVLLALRYDLVPHRNEIANWLAAASNDFYFMGRKAAMIDLCPSVVQADLLPIWLTDQIPVALLYQIEELGGDHQFLKMHIESRLPGILEQTKNSADIYFLDRYVQADWWKLPNYTEALKKLLGIARGNMLMQVIALVIKTGNQQAFKDELSKRYVDSMTNIETARILLEADIPISEKDKKEVLDTLIKYDELKLAQHLKELPISG